MVEEMIYINNSRDYSLLFHILFPGLKLGFHHERPTNKRLSQNNRNYGIGFTVNGIKSYEISSKLSNFSRVESGKH